MKRLSLLTIILAIASSIVGSKLYLADDLIYYFPYPDGTASVSGAAVTADELNIPTHILIPDGYLNSNAADPEHMSKYRVTIIGEGAFMSNNGYTKVTLPDSLERIDAQAFYSCSKMVIDKWPATIKQVGMLAFFNCAQLTSIEMPDIEKVGQQAFSRCTKLKNVVFGDKLDSLPKNTFSADSQLESVVLGSGLKDIQSNVFSRCYALSTITCSAVTPPTVDAKSFQYVTTSNLTLNVPCNSINDYKSANIWKTFGTIQSFSSYNFTAVAADYLGYINVIKKPSDCNDYQVDIEAVANPDYEFDHWSDNTTNPHYVFTLTQDSDLIAYFTPIEKDTISDTLYYCQSSFPYHWADANQYITKAGTYTYNQLGAKHVLQLTIFTYPAYQIDEYATICPNESYEWQGETFNKSGNYAITMATIHGCDSTIVLHLTVLEPIVKDFNVNICEGEAVTLFSDTLIKTEGIFVRHYNNYLGCDSVVTLTVKFNDPYVLTTSVECFKGRTNLGDLYGKIDIVRDGSCDNTVTITPTATNDNYHFSHWRLGSDSDAPALADNPLVIDLDSDLHIRAIFYDNDRTDIGNLNENDIRYIYDIQGRLLRHGLGVTTEGLQNGIYIIKSQNNVQKTIVIK